MLLGANGALADMTIGRSPLEGWSIYFVAGVLASVCFARTFVRPDILRGISWGFALWLAETGIFAAFGRSLLGAYFDRLLATSSLILWVTWGALIGVSCASLLSGRRPIRVLAGSIVYVVVTAVVLRTLLIQPFKVPYGSMEPTARIGDYFLASKFSYGYSRYSLPFSPPLFSGRIFPALPERGDVVVFRLPRADDDGEWIARVIGLPGDVVQVINGQLLLNSQPIRREALSSDTGTFAGRSQPVSRWRETLPNGVAYETFEPAGSYMGNTGAYNVPANRYFVMADNRHWTDSRALSQIGFIPFENLVGRVDVVFANPSLTSPAAAAVHGTAMIARAGEVVER